MKKKLIITLLLVIGLVSITVGVTFAFFNYTRTGQDNTLSVGRIYFNHTQDGRINLSDVFPISKNNINTDTKNVGTFEINIEGDTDYTGGIEYLVSAVNANITTSTGKIVPISLDISVEGLGTYENNYFTERENKNSKIYKRLTGNGIMGDGNLLVGYIPQNTTLGTPSGIDGKITIKAYIDQDKVAISDTYDGNESDNMGTTTEWVGDRVVLTTDEWNAFQDSGISFQVKVEANEDIWVEETLYDIVERQTVMDNVNSTFVNNTTPGIDFSQISSDTNGKGVYTFSSTANDAYPVMYYRGAVDNNNVLFANKCWKMIRTTDTGGVKLIYNGENKGTTDAPACNNTGADTQITLNINGTDTNTFKFSKGNAYLKFSGYMYSSENFDGQDNYEENSKFGNGIVWDGINYTITDTSDTLDANHHYTCGTANTITCSSIRYYARYNELDQFHDNYILNNGDTIEILLKKMLENGNVNSNAKDMVDYWYGENIDNTKYNSEIEDTVYCNERSIYQLGGLNPNGGGVLSFLNYSSLKEASVTFNPTIKCSRVTDSFTKKSTNGNGLLSYSIGLITFDEIMLAGGKYRTKNANYYLYTGVGYWSMSPSIFPMVQFFRVNSTGQLNNADSVSTLGLRPVISLKNNTAILDNDADGTVSKPYVIK